MWKRRKEDTEDESFAPESAPAAPVAATPLVRQQSPAPKREASIGKSVVIKGDILAKEDLFLDGKVFGTVDIAGHKLTIGANGKVEAAIKAREVDVVGAVQGDIQAVDKITIRKDAQLEGNLQSASISIEDGAYFKGSIDIVRPAPVKAPPEVRPAAKPEIPSPRTPPPSTKPGGPATQTKL